MPLSEVNAPYYRSGSARFEQGDIFRDIKIVEWADVQGDAISVIERGLAYSVLLSQDCDLEHDFNNRSSNEQESKDKYLQSLLLCPAYQAEKFREGDHLKELGLTMRRISSDEWRKLRNNDVYRYHFLSESPDLQVPSLVLDFKHYFTVPRDVLYRPSFENCYVATLEILYRESLSVRFAHYLSRIALPEMMA